MGSCSFITPVSREGLADGYDVIALPDGGKSLRQRYSPWPDADAAFRHAVGNALIEEGSGGYTGTIAEKHEYVTIATAASTQEAEAIATRLLDADDPRIADKWGPAGCVEITDGDDTYLFFGRAPS